MKFLHCLFSLFFVSTCFSEQLHDFTQIKSAVTDGKSIRIFVDYTKCSLPKEGIVPNNAAVFTPNAMALTADGKIGAYILYFTRKDPRYPNTSVYQYLTYLLANDNTLKLTFSVLSPKDYVPLEDETSIKCKIDDGVNIFIQ